MTVAGAREARPPPRPLEPASLLAQSVDLDRWESRTQELRQAQARLRVLVRTSNDISGDLALPVVLRQIVEAACELVPARYGALGVIGPDGGLEQFVHHGIDEDTVARIGRLPQGEGLLGALTSDPVPIRLRTISDDPRSVGFPAHHPPMDSFIGVPIRIRGVVFGNLYLTERTGEGDFSAEDEELLGGLATAAAAAIDNARLYAESKHKQDWLAASAEVTRHLLSVDGGQPLPLITRRVAEMADADVVNLVLPSADPDRLSVEVATGEGAAELAGSTYNAKGTLAADAIRSGRPILIGDVSENPLVTVHVASVVAVGPVMAIPLVGQHGSRGALVIGRLRGRRRFTDSDLDMAMTFANHAAVALELADARIDLQRFTLLEDRHRIARDLHDHVIQRLFAAGMTLQSVAGTLTGNLQAARVGQVIDDLDATIRQIRTSIFQLSGPIGPESTVRARLLDVTHELSAILGFSPAVTFEGPVDTLVTRSVGDDIVAVLREALTNVAKHAQAQHVAVTVRVVPPLLTLDVVDDGVGIGQTHRSSGLANLRRRAEQYGGTLTTLTAKGTHLQWTICLP